MEKIIESHCKYVLTIEEICEKFGIKEKIRTAIIPSTHKPKKLLLYPEQ